MAEKACIVYIKCDLSQDKSVEFRRMTVVTIIAYIALNHFSGGDWSGWLLVLPVFMDMVLIDKLDK